MAENKVDLVCTEQKGRYMITNQDVSQGEILFVWKPYVIVPYVTRKDYVCANCIHISTDQTHLNKMIACSQNCHDAFYCSSKCEQGHWNKFHQYECSFLDKIFALQDFGFNEEVVNYARVVMRMLTQRLQEMLDKPHDLSIDCLTHPFPIKFLIQVRNFAFGRRDLSMESAAFFTSLFKHAVQEIPNKSINLCFAFTLYGVYRSCEILQKENNAFMSFVYLYLNTLTKRAFGPGETFSRYGYR